MLRGLRHRSSSRRSYVVSSSDDEDDNVASSRHIVTPPPGLVSPDQNNTPYCNNSNSKNRYPEQPSLQVTESRSTVSVSSSSDGSMFSSESPNLDDDSADPPDTLAHESYLNGTIPDLEDILRSFGSKSRGTKARRNKDILDKPLFENTDDVEDDNSNNSSYNSGFSSSSESSFESIPDTTQIAAFYSNIEDSPPSVANIVSLTPTISPTSATSDIHNFSSSDWKDERVAHKVPTSRTDLKCQRNERRKKSRASKMKKNSSKVASVGNGNYNEDDNRSRQSFLSRTNSLINTSKSFGKNWSRKKRIDQFVPNLSDFEKNEKLLIVEPMNEKGSESTAIGTTVTFMIDPETIALTSTTAILSSSNNVNKVLISMSKKSHVVERFDVDTGELISAVVVDLESSKQSSQNPKSLSNANQEDQVDPLALPKVKLDLELSENESPQKSCGSSGEPVVNHDITTTNQVIENMVLLFAKSDVEGIRRLLGESLESSISSLSTSSSTLSRNVLFDTSIDDGIDIEDDGSDDKGGSDKQKAKHLRTNKLLSLKGAYKQPSKSLQAQYLTNDYTLPLSMRGVITHYSVSILLIEPVHKVFEIVMVDVTRSMSLKEALVSACLAAADPMLAEQTYVSLCSDVKVLSNMSSPVSKLIHKPTDLSTNENVRSDNKATSDNTKQKEALMRREMERQLLVAVPLKSNFKECQMIRRVLWKNTKLQLWWSTYQNEHAVAPWSANASAAPSSSTILSPMKFPQPVAI